MKKEQERIRSIDSLSHLPRVEKEQRLNPKYLFEKRVRMMKSIYCDHTIMKSRFLGGSHIATAVGRKRTMMIQLLPETLE